MPFQFSQIKSLTAKISYAICKIGLAYENSNLDPGPSNEIAKTPRTPNNEH